MIPFTPPAGKRLSRMPLESLPGALCSHARRLAELRDALAATLSGEEASHLVGVSADEKRLVVFADSSAWCTRLRYRAPELEAAARALLGTHPRMSFRVQPPRFRGTEAPRRALPDRAIAALNAAARTIGDPALAAALRRLAGRDA